MTSGVFDEMTPYPMYDQVENREPFPLPIDIDAEGLTRCRQSKLSHNLSGVEVIKDDWTGAKVNFYL